MATSIEKELFGKTSKGEDVYKYVNLIVKSDVLLYVIRGV